MKRTPLSLAILIAIGAASLATAKPITTTVKVQGGEIEGIQNSESAIVSFKGIPFAAPPVGDLRWKRPQPVKSWKGVRRADAFAAGPMQDAQIIRAMGGSLSNISEDCLYLNVWTPAKDAREKLPVMVWIYGGGFTSGTTSLPVYDGAKLAEKGVIVVSVAYRVGAFGFLSTSELTAESGGSGNYGLQDQIAALRWVKHNIARFGGDPSRVTIFGESAGGISVGLLTVAPAAHGLFQRAISESGGSTAPINQNDEADLFVRSLKLAENTGAAFLHEIGCSNIAQARALPAQKIQSAIIGFKRFWPTADGATLPRLDAVQLYQARKFNDTPVLIGSNSDEGAMFTLPGATHDSFEKRLRADYGPAADAMLAAYPHATNAEAFRSSKDLFRDAVFAWPTWTWAKLESTYGANKAYVYYFDRPTTSSPDGSSHAAEVRYVFGNLNAWSGPTKPADAALSQSIQSYWVNFAATGNPNGPGLSSWPAFAGYNPQVLSFSTNATAIAYPNLKKLEAFDQYFTWRRVTPSK